MDIRRIALRASILSLAVGMAACSSDSDSGGGGDTGTTADTGATDTGGMADGSGSDAGMGSDATDDSGGGGGGVPLSVTFTLRNGNPGGLSRWVQVRTNIDTPGWWSIQEDSLTPVDLGTHDSCALDNCGEEGAGCPDGDISEIQELAAGESISGTWDLTLYERVQENATTCEQAYEATEARYRVNLCWSPNAPVDGVLPPGTISCTRLPFNIGIDSEVTYAIEGQSTCGDGDCDAGETSIVCPEDCSGVTPGVVQLSCNQYCNKAFECDENVRRDECQVGCSDQAAELATASEDCLQAVADYFSCLGASDCDALAAETACTIEQGAAASACN